MNAPLVVNTPDGPKPVTVKIKRVSYVCPQCGSGEHLYWDARATWSVIEQKMELTATLDTCNCDSPTCDGEEVHAVEVELPEPQGEWQRNVTVRGIHD